MGLLLPAEPTEDDIAWATGVELAAAIAAGRLTSQRAVRALASRIRRVDAGGVNAVAILAERRALARAAEADAATARGECWGPLHGVPMTVKENNEVEGLDATIGDPVRGGGGS
jgi:amidase